MWTVPCSSSDDGVNMRRAIFDGGMAAMMLIQQGGVA